MTGEGEAFYLPEHDCYYAIRDKQLLFYHSPDGVCHIASDELNALECIHVDMELFDTFKDKLVGFNINSGWSLFYDFDYTPKGVSGNYAAVDFDFNNEQHFLAAARIINGGEDGDINPERLRRWTKFPTFDPSLWVLIEDTHTHNPVAVGVCTYHKQAKETDLDWIYVLPEYHGKGAGRFLIEEIIRRSIHRSAVIRVGGLEEFYLRCGFYCKKQWAWVVKPGFAMNEQ